MVICMYNNKKFEIISLGSNCLPRTVLTRGGIKPSKAEKELSCPFDLVRHTLNRIIHYLATDFEDYFDDIYFDIKKRNFLDFRKKGLWKKKDGTVFFHDRDCKYDNLEKLTERISHRIDNFRELISSKRPVLFVLNIQEDEDKVEELYNLLKLKMDKTPFVLAILDIGKIIKYTITNPNIYILKLPKPIPNYHNGYNGWNSKKWRNSELAKYVELLICDFIQDILENNQIFQNQK